MRVIRHFLRSASAKVLVAYREDAAAPPVVDGGEDDVGELLFAVAEDGEAEQLGAGAVRRDWTRSFSGIP